MIQEHSSSTHGLEKAFNPYDPPPSALQGDKVKIKAIKYLGADVFAFDGHHKEIARIRKALLQEDTVDFQDWKPRKRFGLFPVGDASFMAPMKSVQAALQKNIDFREKYGALIEEAISAFREKHSAEQENDLLGDGAFKKTMPLTRALWDADKANPLLKLTDTSFASVSNLWSYLGDTCHEAVIVVGSGNAGWSLQEIRVTGAAKEKLDGLPDVSSIDGVYKDGALRELLSAVKNARSSQERHAAGEGTGIRRP